MDNSFWGEFKKFAMRGNMMDLAVGVVIGTAFNNIITSLVNNIITPPLGLLLGRVDFQALGIPLGGTVIIKYGLFIQAIFDFFLTALALFIAIRFINRLTPKKPEDVPEPAKTPELVVLEDIRDTLKKQNA